MSLAIAGVEPKTALAMVMTPGFWLLRAAMATALPYPTFLWKWMRPTGKTNTSPLFKVFLMSLFSGFDVTNPTSRQPSRTVKISDARGCVCGGFKPLGAKSRRAKDIPLVLSHGITSAVKIVTFTPS